MQPKLESESPLKFVSYMYMYIHCACIVYLDPLVLLCHHAGTELPYLNCQPAVHRDQEYTECHTCQECQTYLHNTYRDIHILNAMQLSSVLCGSTAIIYGATHTMYMYMYVLMVTLLHVYEGPTIYM